MEIRGWVYLITNPAMPGLVKIGYSSRDPSIRAEDFDGSGVPFKYEVIYDILVVDPFAVEQKVHAALNAYRQGKEWFSINPKDAIEKIREISKGRSLGETIHEGLKESFASKQTVYPWAWETYSVPEEMLDFFGRDFFLAIEKIVALAHWEMRYLVWDRIALHNIAYQRYEVLEQDLQNYLEAEGVRIDRIGYWLLTTIESLTRNYMGTHHPATPFIWESNNISQQELDWFGKTTFEVVKKVAQRTMAGSLKNCDWGPEEFYEDDWDEDDV